MTKELLIREDDTLPPMKVLTIMSGVGKVWVECWPKGKCPWIGA